MYLGSCGRGSGQGSSGSARAKRILALANVDNNKSTGPTSLIDQVAASPAPPLSRNDVELMNMIFNNKIETSEIHSNGTSMEIEVPEQLLTGIDDSMCAATSSAHNLTDNQIPVRNFVLPASNRSNGNGTILASEQLAPSSPEVLWSEYLNPPTPLQDIHSPAENVAKQTKCRRALFPSANNNDNWETLIPGPLDDGKHQHQLTTIDQNVEKGKESLPLYYDLETVVVLDPPDKNGYELPLSVDVIENMEVIFQEHQVDPGTMDDENELLDPGLPLPEVTPPAVTRKKRQPAPISNSPRKRQNIAGWKATAAKKAYNAGVEYVNWRGKHVSAKNIGPGCSPDKCKRNCHQRVSMEEREKIFKSYYSIVDANRKWDFISRLVKKESVARKTTDDISRRQNTYKYSMVLSNSTLVTVCQKFFLDTIDQSQQVVKTALTKLQKDGKNVISPDKRGQHKKRGEINPAIKASVRAHIASIPTVESHYCRKTSKHKFLPDNLNVRKLHKMYLLERGDNSPNTANLRQYRDIFKNEFHLKFLKLKKDRCSQCENWKYRTAAEKSEEGAQEKYDLHIANKNRGQELKKEDSLRAKTKEDLCVASFDFQKILYSPKGENAAYFYKNKFKCYNFTVFDHRTKEGSCFVWDQTIASKGANEVASCLLLFMEEKVKAGIKEFVFYSDNCWSQNKNSKVLSMMNFAAVKYNCKITHRFLEKGHTHMEVDNVHACIENRSKNIDIFTPGQWYAIIKISKINDPKYKVIEMEQNNILEFKDLAIHHKWNLGVTKLREIVLAENIAYFKHNYDDEAKEITPLPPRKGRPVNLPTFRLKQAYNKKFAVPDTILESLQWFCDNGHIPSACQPFYKTLFTPAEDLIANHPTDSQEEDESDSDSEVHHNDSD